MVGDNVAPTASNVNITGTSQVGQILSGNYQYADVENDPEGISTFQWYRCDNTNGTGKVAISGATSRDYILVTTDQDKYMFLEVTPKANAGTLTGISVLSSASNKVESVTTNSTALTIALVAVINNPVGTPDTVDVIGLHSGDEVRVYNSLTNQNSLGTGVVQEGQTAVKLIIQQLSIEAGTIYVTVQNPGKNESVRTPKEYTAENGQTVDECFIATAAFGSKFNWPVALLRHFRDQYLLTNSWGSGFVNFYYRNSPPIAAMIASSQPLRIMARVLLAPVVALVYLMYHPLLMVTVLLIVFLIYRYRLRRRYVQV